MAESCACGSELTVHDGGRCARHARMVRTIRAAWESEDDDLFDDLFDLSDGMGGEVVEGDWSAIRDSSTEAIEAMYARAVRG